MTLYDEQRTAVATLIEPLLFGTQVEDLLHQVIAERVVNYLNALQPTVMMSRTDALEWAADYVEKNKLYAQPNNRGYTEKSDARPEKDEAVLKFARFAMGEEK